MKLKDTCSLEENEWSYGFSSSQVWMWDLDYKESWAPKNWCFWTVVLEKTLESPLDCKEIKPVNAKGNQSWIFIGRTDAEAEAPILWLPDVKNWLIVKHPDAGKDWRKEEKGMTEDEMPSPTWWTWVWASSRSWWWTRKPGALQSMVSQRAGHNWATEVKWLATPWTVACQSPLSSTIFQSLLKLISIELMMPLNHLILYCPLHLLPSIFPRINIFSNGLIGKAGFLHQAAKGLELPLQDQSFQWIFRVS